MKNLTEKELLDTRLCDLKIKIEGSPMHACIKQVLKELSKKGIKVTPHFWISDEWFSPDGVLGIAIPFYLLHPRLLKLEKKMMGTAEGGTKASSCKILRHELGHALDNGFKLRNLKTRQSLFGLTSEPYPDFYYPNKESTKYVHHLEDWYSQAHPDEDWAESFAVWLSNPNWTKKFSIGKCRNKIEYIDKVFTGLKGKKPKVTRKFELDPISEKKQTLREYYQKKRKKFKAAPEKLNPDIIKYLKRYKKDLYKELAKKTNQNKYNLNQIYRLIYLKNEVKFTGKLTKKKAINLFTRHGVKYFRKSRIRIAM